MTRVCELSRVSRLGDLAPSSVVEALGKLSSQEKYATRTLAAYATGVKAFSMWAWKDGRTADYNLKGLAKPNDKTDRRRVRRPLTDDELRHLIDTTRQAPPFRRASGADRSALYMVASLTGFRRDELLSLTPTSFELASQPPVVDCEAAYTKNKDRAEQPLPVCSVPSIKKWLADKTPGKPVFESIPRFRTGVMLRRDLARCDIPFKTSAGSNRSPLPETWLHHDAEQEAWCLRQGPPNAGPTCRHEVDTQRV